MILNPININCLDELLPFTEKIPARSCDYTPGNLIMWAQYMHYRYTIEEETLFISCLSQTDMQKKAFLMPIGAMPLKASIERLKEFCTRTKRELRLTAVPEPFIEEIKALLPTHRIEPMDEWSDYIYLANSLATLQGHSLNKKRNRFNKFIAQYPEHTYSRVTLEDIPEIITFLRGANDCHDQTIMRCYEQEQCISTVTNLPRYNQPAGIIRIEGKIVAFTLGEIFGDTLYIHIEKALREYPGLSECINKYFAADILDEHPRLAFINREEDLGDPGLRQAKRSYSPIDMLNRYEFIAE